MYRVLIFFKVLEYNLSVGLLISTLVRNATVRLGHEGLRTSSLVSSTCAAANAMPLNAAIMSILRLSLNLASYGVVVSNLHPSLHHIYITTTTRY